MTLTQLSYIIAVETHGHFGRAAEACHVSQPGLSMQVRKLEKELGAVLFDRSRSPVVPTELGRLVVEQSRVVLREAGRIRELRDEAGGEVTGELRVGVLPTLGPYLLPRFVQRLAQSHPRLQLVLEEALTGTILERLRNETLDAGLIATPGTGGLVEQPLFDEPFVAFVNTGHALAQRAEVTPDQLPREDFWVLSEEHCLRAQVLRLCSGSNRDHCSRGIRMESGNLETLRRLVVHSGGYTLLPVLAADELAGDQARARVVPFAQPAPSRRVVLVRRRTYLKRSSVEAFVQCLVDNLPDTVRRLPPGDSAQAESDS